MTSRTCRDQLVETLQLDLVGPRNDHAFAHELLPQSPQRWYLTGYLVPENAPEEERRSQDESDDLDQPFVADASTLDPASRERPDQPLPGGAGDDNDTPEQTTQVNYRPSSIGLTVLLPAGTGTVTATVRWGDYVRESHGDDDEAGDDEIDRAYEQELAAETAEIEVEQAARSRGGR
jgi:hypothetical protein